MQEPAEVEITRERSLPKLVKVIFLIFSALGIGIAVFYIFNFSVRGQTLLDAAYYYLLFALFSSCAFLILPARKKQKRVPWYDLVCAALICGIAFYFFLKSWEIRVEGWIPASPLNSFLGLIFSLLVLEGGRRMGGFIYLVVCIIFGLYPIFAQHLPGILYGMSFPFKMVISLHVFGSEGLLGLPMKVIGEILIGFLIFAGVLIASGAGKFFLDVALALLGRFRGGPAKVAVVSSGFFGSVSGSILSNVVATGSVTIPTMKRVGYPAHYAGAIEACASSGGVLMPPIMGAVAFVMCAVLNIDYATVIVAAAVPSILYYIGLLLQIDGYAAKVGLKGLPREETPSLRETLKEGWPFITVIFFLLWGLLYMRWERMTPFYASGLMFLLSFTSRKTMMTPKRIVASLTTVGKLITQTVAIILPIGFVICGLNVTGVTNAFTAGLVTLGGGNVFLILAMGMAACYILGMAGMIVAAYVFLAVTLAPAVIQLGQLNELAVHLFIIYYAMLAGITPPVAAGAFLGASIAGAHPMRTALRAMRLGIVIYFIPFFFVYNPSLILQGPIFDIICSFTLCLLGILFIAAGLEGYLVMVGTVGLLVRPLLVIAGFLIAFPELKTGVVGAVIAFFSVAIALRRSKGKK